MKNKLYKLLEDNWEVVEDKVFHDKRYQDAFKIIQETYKELEQEGLVSEPLVLGFTQEKPRHYMQFGKKRIDFTLEGRRKKNIFTQLKDLTDDKLLKNIVYQCNCIYNYALDEYLNPIILWKHITEEAGIAILEAKRFTDCVDADKIVIDIYINIINQSYGTCHVKEDVDTLYLVFHKFGENRVGKFRKYYTEEGKVKCNRHSEIMVTLKLNEPQQILSYTSEQIATANSKEGKNEERD